MAVVVEMAVSTTAFAWWGKLAGSAGAVLARCWVLRERALRLGSSVGPVGPPVVVGWLVWIVPVVEPLPGQGVGAGGGEEFRP